MDDRLVTEILTGDSDEIAEIKANLNILDGFIKLARELDELPEVGKRFYEESRSLYQATCTHRAMPDLETMLAKFFGPPVKPAGKPLPRKLRKNSSVKYLGGIEKGQSLFLLPLKSGEFYGALWPWRRNKSKIEIHLGYCSDWMVDDHYQQLETLIKKSLSQSAFQQMDTGVGGQIRGIGLPSFLQMSEMEQSSFTLHVTANGQAGQLYVSEGQLIAAETEDLMGRDAAYRIISWDDATIEIAPADTTKMDEIHQPLMHVLMESLKIKDEVGTTTEAPPAPPPPKRPSAGAARRRLVRLEKAPTPQQPTRKSRFSTVFAILLGLLVVVGSGAVITLYVLNKQMETDTYDDLRRQVEKTVTDQEKLNLLQNYLMKYPGTPYVASIQTDIDHITKGMEDQAFEQATLKISSLPVDEQYERKAIEIYSEFLEKYPNSKYEKKINNSISDIKNLIDQYYYEELKRAARLDFSQRLKAYEIYINRFPNGSYQSDVKTLINEMGKQYLAYLATEDVECEKKRRWEPCIKKYESFAADYEGSALAEEAATKIAALKDASDLYALNKETGGFGNDYQKAYQAYKDYLEANPQSTKRKEVEAEIAALEKQLGTQRKWESIRSYALNPQNSLFDRIQRLDGYLRSNLSGPYAGDAQELMERLERERQYALRQQNALTRQQEEAARIQRQKAEQAMRAQRTRQFQATMESELSGLPRYQSNGNGTFTDQNTGLTWTLLDSNQALGGCLNYADAATYVKNLTTGGYTDWRLPTASELAAIHKQRPFFPRGNADWYWSADTYSKGFHTVADVVSATPETVFQREDRRVDECGAVRAVRP